jgi:hypothetical protein
MRPNDRLTDRPTPPHTILLDRGESLEEPTHPFWGKLYTRIGDGHFTQIIQGHRRHDGRYAGQ